MNETQIRAQKNEHAKRSLKEKMGNHFEMQREIHDRAHYKVSLGRERPGGGGISFNADKYKIVVAKSNEL